LRLGRRKRVVQLSKIGTYRVGCASLPDDQYRLADHHGPSSKADDIAEFQRGEQVRFPAERPGAPVFE
jgi:hypothetical protein